MSQHRKRTHLGRPIRIQELFSWIAEKVVGEKAVAVRYRRKFETLEGVFGITTIECRHVFDGTDDGGDSLKREMLEVVAERALVGDLEPRSGLFVPIFDRRNGQSDGVAVYNHTIDKGADFRRRG